MGSYEKNIKICFVTREYAHPNMGKTGGIGVFLKQFTQELKQHNFEIVIFTFGTQALKFNDAGVSVVKIKDLSSFNEWIKAPLRRHEVPGYITIKMILEYINRFYISMYLSFFVKKHRFDLLEFHDYGGDAPFFLGRLPKVIRCHGSALTLHNFMGYHKRITDTIFEKLLFKRFSKHVVAVSKSSANMTKQAFSLNTIPQVIYNGVALPEVTNNAKKHYLDFPTLPKSIFYFGSIRERKGIDIACEVFNTVVEKYPDASFHVLGNNNNQHWDKVSVFILSKKALKRTTYYGAIPNNQIFMYLKQAHVVLFPSYGENFSIALLEVMAIGKVAITSDISAFKEIIIPNQNGFIALTKDDYVKVISNIFNGNIDVETISKNAKITIETQFLSENIIQENINYYKSIL